VIAPRTWIASNSVGGLKLLLLKDMRVFIVHAHHEPKSFNGSLTRHATTALEAAGHAVVVSDLYAMGFNPVSDRRNFITTKDPNFLHQQSEEIYASENKGFAPDIRAEMDKLSWCDVLILQFPLWWFGLPAILKGWVDRVFAMHWAYGGGKYYDRGPFAGKRAMCSVTVGNVASAYSESGMNGPISSILFPIHHGILYFTGFTVIEPFVIFAPRRMGQQEREIHLKSHSDRLLNLSSAPLLAYRKLEEHDEKWVLKIPPKN
jgi:NAD(P)H dehydrogenase (quinone)